ncbi:thiamine diphosphokinase [bacterium]|nr:thiamine diphosphokinase [bacterium]
MKTVILANGKYPSHKVPVKHLTEADLIVCCDGAAEKLVAHGLEPGIITGDLDSVSPALKQRYEKILVPDADQETNDLTKAVKWCVTQGIEEVVILGATGIREDHTLGNISLLADYSRLLKATIVTDTGSFRVFDRSVTISSSPGQQVSVFSPDPGLAITSSGLRYPLKGLKLSSWWRGTLNEAEGESFRLEFTGGQLIVFMEFAEQG